MSRNFNYLLLITVLSLVSCKSSNSIQLKDSSEINSDKSSSLNIAQVIKEASIVHIDKTERIVTIRSNKPLNKGYYVTITRTNEEESSVLKLYDTSYETVFIADILEGSPKMNDSVALTTEKRNQELDLIYTEAIID